jgi:hypothetical protein
MDFFRGFGFFGNKQPGNGSEVTPCAFLAARRYQLKAFLPRLPRFPRETYTVNREASIVNHVEKRETRDEMQMNAVC